MSNTFLDSSSNALTVTRNGNVAQGSFSPYNQNAVADSGWSVYFDGNGDFLNISASSSLALGSGDFTIECWFYAGKTGDHYLFDMRTASGIYVYLDNTSLNYIAAQVGSTGQINAGTYASNTWNHFAVVRSGSGSNNVSFYLNGVRTTQATDTTNYSTNTPIFIGRRHTDFSGAFGFMNGYISNFRVIKGTALYTSAFTPSTTPLTAVANTALLACHTTTLVDGSTNAFTITKNGDTKVSSVSPFDVDAGRWSTYFDGTGDYLTAPDSDAWNFGSGNFTVEAWIYPVASPNQPLIVGQWASSGYSWAIQLSNNSSRNLRFLINTGSIVDIVSTSPVSLNSWSHVALVRNGNVFTAYLNGVSVATTTNSGTLTDAATSLSIGACADNTQPFNGYISNVRVIKGTALYTSAFTPSTTPLTAVTNTVLLTCQDAIFDDASSNNFSITRNGDARTSTFSPYSPYTSGYWSGYFDGSGDHLSVPASTDFAFGTGDYTIEFWMNHSSSLNIARTVFDTRPTSTSGNYPLIFIDTDATLKFSVTSPRITSSAIQTNTWYHIAVCRASGSTRMFINGVQTGSTFTDTINYLQDGVKVAWNAFSAGVITGYISNLRLIKGTALYTSTFTPSTTPLTNVAGTVLLTLNDNRFVDDSLYQRAITKFGDVRVSTSVPFLTPNNYSKTLNGGSAYFDGTDWLSIPDSANYDFATNDFTVEAWIYPTTAGTVRVICCHISNNAGFSFELDTSNQLKVWIAGAYVLTASGGGVVANAWNHVTMVRSSGTLRLFLNGNQVGSVANSTSITGATGVFAVGATPSATALFTGYISDLNVVNGQALYTSNFVPPKSRIADAGASLLLNFTNTSVTDFAAKNNAELVGSVTLDTAAKKFGSASFNFGTSGANCLRFADSPDLRMGTSDFTIEGWFRPLSGMTGTRFFYQKGVNTTGGLLLGVSTNNVIFRSAGTTDLSVTVSLSTTDFTHIAFVRTGTTRQIFVGGVLVGSDTVSFTMNDTSVTEIGAVSGPASDANKYYGYIDDLRITKDVARYNTNITVPTTALTSDANTSLLVGQNGSFKDNSSANRTLTVAGNTVVNYRHPFSTPSGYWSNSFDGTGDYLTLSSNASMDFGTGAFTIEGWVNTTIKTMSGSASRTIIGNAGNTYRMQLFINISSGVLTFGNTGALLTGTSDIANGQWNHFAIVRENTSANGIKMYVNGILQATGTNTENYVSSTIYIGAFDPSNGGFWNGHISNLRIVKGSAVYTSNFTPSMTPLTAVPGTVLLTCQDSTFKDNSSSAVTLTKFGDVVSDQFSPYMRDAGFWSAQFDGTGDYLSFANSSNFAFGTGNFTIEFWINAPLNNDKFLVGGRSAVGTMHITTGGFSSTAGVLRYVGSSTIVSSAVITDNSWHHCAIVRSSNTITLYVDGISSGTGTDSTNYSTTSGTWTVGCNDFSFPSNVNTNNLTGYISNLRIVNGTALYTSAFTPSTTPLTAVSGTSLLTCRDIFLRDASTNTFTITRNGDVKSHWQSPFFLDGKWSMYFDGNGDYLSFPVTGTDFTFGTGNYTIECWINYSGKGSTANVIDKWNVGGGFMFLMRFNNGTTFQVHTTNNSINSTSAIPLNTWTHIAFVRNNNVHTLYVNGVPSGNFTSSGSEVTPTGNIQIGAGASGNEAYIGYISNLRIVKGTAVYTGGFTPPTATFPTKGVNV